MVGWLSEGVFRGLRRGRGRQIFETAMAQTKDLSRAFVRARAPRVKSASVVAQRLEDQFRRAADGVRTATDSRPPSSSS